MTTKDQLCELYNLLHQFDFAKDNMELDPTYFLNEANKVAHRFNALKDQIAGLPIVTVKPVDAKVVSEVMSVVTLAEEFHKN